MIDNQEVLLRLILASIMGAVIGYERQSRHKSAGLRTNILVCLGSCLIMVLSQDIYSAVVGYTNADPARLAAQVVSGIGFLGAGAIMKEGLTVTGLTTAACLWVVAGVGLAIGCGHYMAALFTTLIVFITLAVISRFDHIFDSERPVRITIHAVNEENFIADISNCLTNMRLFVNGIKVQNADTEIDNTADRQYIYITIDAFNAYNINNIIIADKIRKSFKNVISVNVI